MLESNWRKEANNDVLRSGDRIGQIIGVIVTFLVAGFLLSHWTGDTGFYTSDFNEWDAFILFGPLLFGIVPNAFRVVIGRKNMVRPLDAFGTIIFALSALYFLSNFHFDMQFFAEPLPDWLRFVIDWIDEGWARFFLIIGAVGGSIATVWNIVTYVKVRELLKSKE